MNWCIYEQDGDTIMVLDRDAIEDFISALEKLRDPDIGEISSPTISNEGVARFVVRREDPADEG